MRPETRAAVEAAAYFVVPQSAIDTIPESREPEVTRFTRAGRPPSVVLPPSPISSIGRPRGSATHRRADYWRDYSRWRYANDPEYRARRMASVKRAKQKKRGAR